MLLYRIRDKILKAEPKIRDVEKVDLDDAKIALISFGASARPSYGAIKQAREEDIKVGLYRLRTIWPFPETEVKDLANEMDALIVVEMNIGKLVLEVERVVKGNSNVFSLNKIGGVVPSVNEILEKIREVSQ
jgi:2-oxoglutarate ferredoxin oxidoreductase subunit alpha